MAGEDKFPDTDPEQGEDWGSKDGPSAASAADRGAAGEAGGIAQPGHTEPSFSSADNGGGSPLDRHDDSVSDGGGASPAPLVDSDYADDFPGVPGAADDDLSPQEDPDPGFSAFADELDDPLADWPAPETALDSLPEMRGRSGANATESQGDPAADDLLDGSAQSTGWQAGDEPGLADDDFSEAAFFTDPVQPDPADEYAARASGEADVSTPGVDRDEAAPRAPADLEGASGHGFDQHFDNDDNDLRPTPERASSTVTEQPEASGIDFGRDHAYRDLGDLQSGRDNTTDTAGADDRTAMADDSEAFVDDFLNDLDDPDFPDDRAVPMRDSAADSVVDAGAAAALSPIRPTVGDTAARDYGSDLDRAHEGNADARTMKEVGHDERSAGVTAGDSNMPWGMIAVVAVALLLLAAGGLGVVQQRSSLKAEIRDLQAQLATAVAPEEAAAEREQQRRIELENESLAAEIAALEAENQSLAGQLTSLEAQLQEQLAAQELATRKAQAETETSAGRAQNDVKEPTAPADRVAGATSKGGWFVNFGSYAQQAIARRWADRLEVSGGRVVVQEARASGRTVYRVRVVGLPTRDAAERVATALERQHQLPRLWVGQN